MNNTFFLLRSKLNLNVKGINVNRFIKRLKNNDIEIINIFYMGDDEVNIKIYESDYKKIISLKTIYKINILDYHGIIKLKNNVLNNKYILIFIVVALIVLYIISNIIFSIDIVTNDSKMGKNIIEELEILGIKKYKFKKEYDDLQIIKKKILNKYKNDLEWIEIENIGTKYIIRYEPRIINKERNKEPFRHIVALKDAVIYSLSISNGQIVKNINSYVKKGDIIVSGYIKMNDNIKDTVSSSGIVYGKTWYKVTVTYPYNYYENYETGKINKVFVFKFLNKEIELFNFKRYKTKNKKNNNILYNNLLPISFIKQIQKETVIKKEKNTEDELIGKALEYSNKKIKEKLNYDEYIDSYKILNKSYNKDSITLNVFYNLIENITKYENIEEYKEIVE